MFFCCLIITQINRGRLCAGCPHKPKSCTTASVLNQNKVWQRRVLEHIFFSETFSAVAWNLPTWDLLWYYDVKFSSTLFNHYFLISLATDLSWGVMRIELMAFRTLVGCSTNFKSSRGSVVVDQQPKYSHQCASCLVYTKFLLRMWAFFTHTLDHVLQNIMKIHQDNHFFSCACETGANHSPVLSTYCFMQKKINAWTLILSQVFY